jgi:hypothetical protein
MDRNLSIPSVFYQSVRFYVLNEKIARILPFGKISLEAAYDRNGLSSLKRRTQDPAVSATQEINLYGHVVFEPQ